VSGSKLEKLKVWIEGKAKGMPYGCMVQGRGHVLCEWYGGGFSAKSLFEIGSIRKSFNSALVGIGIKEGRSDLQARAVDFWPEICEISGNKYDREITLHQLMSGTSGWLTSDGQGRKFRYNNAAFTAAERAVARIWGFPEDEIAPEVVRRFKIPLEAESWDIYHWTKEFDPKDIENPGPKLAIDSNLRDLVKWGMVWLRGGLWEGREVIPEDYVALATKPANPEIPDAWYGYNWFVNAKKALWPEAPEDSYGHAGWGTFRPSGEESRTYLWICPSLDSVAAMVTDVSVGFANDFLEVPMKITAEWIEHVVHGIVGQT
jgi:CubicO group peptidase (beta-lactamase class C family)